MAVRYSGDAEVRLFWDARRRLYKGTVRDPVVLWRGTVVAAPFSLFSHPRSPDSYDRAASRLLYEAKRWAALRGHRLQVSKKGGRIQVLRVFQSPCPL